LTLTEAPALQPGEFEINQEQICAMNKELEEAQQMQLPDGEDDF
jgi:hypothetical protein